MDDLERILLEPNTIIDLVIPPGVFLESLLFKLLDGSKEIFTIDTQGQINLYVNKHTVDEITGRRNYCPFDENHYVFASSLNDIYDFIDKLRSYRDFILILDSVTFICDTSPDTIKDFANMLWSLIYSCNASIITVNHFKIDSDKKGKLRLTPRMGNYWKKIISFQVEFVSGSDQIKYKISRNNILDM